MYLCFSRCCQRYAFTSLMNRTPSPHRIVTLVLASLIAGALGWHGGTAYGQIPPLPYVSPYDYQLAPPPPPPPPDEADDDAPTLPAGGGLDQPFNPFAPFFIDLGVMVSYWDDIMIYGQVGDLDGPVDDLLVDFGGELEGSFTFTVEDGYFLVWLPQPGPGVHTYTAQVRDVDGNWSDVRHASYIQ